MRGDQVHADAVFDLGEHERPVPAHLAAVAVHYRKIGADGFCEVHLVDDKQGILIA